MKLLTNFAWQLLAFVVSREPVANYLIARAKRTPYFNLAGYMNRDWIFNGYPEGTDGLTGAERQALKRYPRLPSVRIHHILRRDLAPHKHDHPWTWARTIPLKGWYVEERDGAPARVLRKGDTAAISFGEYHHIDRVSDGGVFTLFFVGPWAGDWGFNVDGVKVSPRDYAAMYPERA